MAVGINIISSFDSKGIRKAIDDFKKLDTGAQKFEYGLRTLDKGLTKAVTSLVKYGAAAATAAGVVGYKLVQAGSALEESQSKVGVVFKSSADEVRKFAESSATNIGISEQKALEAAGTYGNLLQAFGLTGEEATKMSLDFVQLASDLASFNNTSIDDALLALRSGLSGETEPLKRYGVALNDIRLKQEAANLGMYEGKGQLSVLAKSQAAYALIMKDTALAQGDFARTSSGAANQQRILAASFQNVAADIGTALLPVFKTFLTFMNDKILPIAQRFAEVVGEEGIGGGIKFLSGEFLNFLSGGNKFKDMILGLIAVMTTLKLVIMAANIATQLFGKSLFANPIGIVIAAAIALAVAIATLYVRFEGFRKVVNTVINAVIGYFENMVNYYIKAINVVIKGINFFGGILGKIGIDIPKLGEIGEVTFSRIGQSAVSATKQVNKFGNAVEEARFKALGLKYSQADKEGGGTPDPTGGAAKKIETAREKLDKYISALKGAGDAERGLADATKSRLNALASLTTAQEAVRKAQEKFNLVTRGYAKDSKEAVEAMRKVEDASRRLRDANLSQQDAVRNLAAAEKRLFDLRNQTLDPETLADAERKLEKSKFGVEEANFRVAEAEKDLAEIRLKPDASAVDIRRAEISLATAKFEVFDAVNAVTRGEKALADLRDNTKQAEEIAEAERELERAKYAVEDATLAVRDATMELTLANAFQTQILEGAKEGSEAYEEALKALQEAQKAEVDASDAVTEALIRERDATLELREAKLKLREVEATTPANIVTKGQGILSGATPNQVTDTTTKTFKETAEAVAEAAQVFGGFYNGIMGSGAFQMFAFADGGIVRKPTIGMVGEAGPEAIIPLSQLGDGGMTVNVTVNAGMGASGQDIGNEIVNVLKRYERRNGALPLTVSG